MAENKDKLELYFIELGKQIAKFRKEKKFSLEELGLQIGLDRSAMHRTENGKPMTVTTIVKLCLALGKQPKDFFVINFDFKSHELGGLVKSKKSPKKKASTKKRIPVKKIKGIKH